jgi:hypothetical protein
MRVECSRQPGRFAQSLSCELRFLLRVQLIEPAGEAEFSRSEQRSIFPSFRHLPALGTTPTAATTVGDKGSPYNGLPLTGLTWPDVSEASVRAPGPECSLRLEKVSKVAPLRESKLTSEGLFRQ